MPDPTPRAAEELRSRERLLYLGCLANIVLGLFLMVGAIVAISEGMSSLDRADEAAEARRRAAEEAPAAEESPIRAVLDAQVAAWNKGDLDGFMAGYWRDERLTFTSGGKVARGWDATRARYLKRYFTPDKDGKLAERGELSFAELRFEAVGPNAALVRGRYHLKLADKADTGLFTLALRKMAGAWVITSDHTSVDCPECPEKDKK